MSAPVFVDTSALYALFLPGDEHHAAARDALERLRKRGDRLVSTPIVVLESCVLFHARAGRAGLLRFRAALDRSPWLERHAVSAAQESQAWGMLGSHADKNWSFVDATSFVVMRALKLRRAFSFDADFAQAGFEMLPEPVG